MQCYHSDLTRSCAGRNHSIDFGMEKLHSEIRYEYDQTDTGAKIMIATANLKALKAVHEFLRFQIDEHRTGDSTEVSDAGKK